MTLPILYSFRRCPYAMRARMAIAASGIAVELREVVLREKPAEMLNLSPKGTVPILVYPNEPSISAHLKSETFSCADHSSADLRIIDESMDIMRWALEAKDPKNWIVEESYDANLELIETNDFDFKYWLDRYKYHDRYPEHNQGYYADRAQPFLESLEERLRKNIYLFGNNRQLADIAIFPFVRQFAAADKAYFDSMDLSYLSKWLDSNIEMRLFKQCMRKFNPWKNGNQPIIF